MVVGHSLVDDGGPFLGTGVSYFTALRRCRHDRARLESDLEFLSYQGFNYFRMLSMVGDHPAWQGREIAPVAFTRRDGGRVEAWPDNWQQLRELIDLAYGTGCGRRSPSSPTRSSCRTRGGGGEWLPTCVTDSISGLVNQTPM